MMKLLSIAAFSLMLAGGAAIAQTPADTDPDASGAGQTNQTSAVDPGPKYLADPARMALFYTDDTMTTLRPAAEIETAWLAMSDEDRAAIKTECEHPTNSIRYEAFCGEILNMQ